MDSKIITESSEPSETLKQVFSNYTQGFYNSYEHADIDSLSTEDFKKESNYDNGSYKNFNNPYHPGNLYAFHVSINSIFKCCNYLSEYSSNNKLYSYLKIYTAKPSLIKP